MARECKAIPQKANSYIVHMYKDLEMTVIMVSEETGFSISSIRRRLISLGELRTQRESTDLSVRLKRRENHYKGVKRKPFSEETKLKMSQSALRRRLPNLKERIYKRSGYADVRVGINCYKREHRYVMERHLGRELFPYECVHHKDGNRLNNDISNLEIMTWEEHSRHHALQNYKKRKRNKYGQFK